jgi:hypothetical protein
MRFFLIDLDKKISLIALQRKYRVRLTAVESHAVGPYEVHAQQLSSLILELPFADSDLAG